MKILPLKGEWPRRTTVTSYSCSRPKVAPASGGRRAGGEGFDDAAAFAKDEPAAATDRAMALLVPAPGQRLQAQDAVPSSSAAGVRVSVVDPWRAAIAAGRFTKTARRAEKRLAVRSAHAGRLVRVLDAAAPLRALELGRGCDVRTDQYNERCRSARKS